jgi:hypothetical protein
LPLAAPNERAASKGGHAIIQRKVDSGGKRKGAGRPKGSKNKERTAIEAGVEMAKDDIAACARRYAAQVLKALALTALYGEGLLAVQAAREPLDRGYGKVPEAAAEPLPTVVEGIGIEPKPNGNGPTEPVRLEDFRNRTGQ